MQPEYPKPLPEHRTLESRLTDFYGVPLHQIPRTDDREIDWGKPKGKEIW